MKKISLDHLQTHSRNLPSFMEIFQRRTLLSLAVLLCGIWAISLAGCSAAAPPPGDRPPPTVNVSQPVTKQIVEWDAYTGRLEPIEFVEIRARVSGYLQAIHFDEGQIVNQGELLFEIDPRPFIATLNGAKASMAQAQSQLAQSKAQLDEARAQKEQADAQLNLADARVKRTRTLRTSNAVAQDELDQREAEFRQAQADVVAAEANIGLAEAGIGTAQAAVQSAEASIEAAELDLSYSKVYAPVTGRISREYVTEGNLVSGGTATSTLLTTITSVSPIYCTFDVNEQQALKYIRLALSGKRESSRSAKNPVYLGLADEKEFPHKGHMEFVDNRFDSNTASIRVRCIFRNEDEVLVPGMFGKVRLPGSASYQAVLIPDSAIGTDQSSQYVYIVVDGKIERRNVEVGPLVDGLRVVRDGLDGSESLVIKGLLLCRPEMVVNAEPAEIEVVEDGLPDTYTPLPQDEWISPGLSSIQMTGNGGQNVQTAVEANEEAVR
ncbi:efflux RND transporter periplasmic adaptor subunit [Bremerella sp. T1]|uniref:efflux RND transporter periplasmic adaptor subunit n=1 Tax=Bremerella sp. TYQ1 TaxID=3119568 RepID=UPI001CC9FABA|nr:efflux RND transporter periplasmic adaptor subunit [Bremerella volcania]UBM37342.1 efflux RND transporter periplasmic adaptor subunit [Bremerella volcania]